MDKRLETIAKRIYYANWKELPNGRFPPVWENASEGVREFARKQARAIEQPGSENPPVRSGWEHSS
jgi:hypothetical protein